MHSAAIFTAVVLLASIDTGLCISCYQCTSTNNPNCKDPFNNAKAVSSVDCNSNEVLNFYNGYLNQIMPAPSTQNAPRYCLKMTIVGSTGDNIIRTCVEGPSNNMNKTCSELERGTAFGQYTPNTLRQPLKYCNICNGENCNSATSQTLSVALGLIAASALAFIAY